MAMRVSRLFALALFAAAMLVAAGAPSRADAANLDSLEQDLVARINAFRSARGLPVLAVSDTLTAAAKWMSTDMGARNYFAHTSLDGRSPTQRMADAGYPAFGTWTGEDLAAGFTTTTDVLNGWINSPAHYAVLVNPQYHAIGVGRGYAPGSTYGWYWTADFGGVVDGGRAAPVARAATATVVATRATSTAPKIQIPPDLGYHAKWVSQSADPTVAPGELASLIVAMKNTGSRGWYRGMDGQQANLGLVDAGGTALGTGWLSQDRLATTTTDYVGPGDVAWFTFNVRAPEAAGDYTLMVRGVIEDATWLEDDGIFFTIHVRAPLRLGCRLSFVR